VRAVSIAAVWTFGWVVALLSEQSPSFKSGVSLVTVPVSVIPADGAEPTRTLTPADVHVLEDGRPQSISFVEVDTRPLSVAVVLDVSSSMLGLAREWAAAALREVAARLGPEDEMCLVVFGAWAIVPVSWTRVGQIDGVDWGQWVLPSSTALLDAVQVSIALMDKASNPRGVVLVLSDGLELVSATPLSDVVTTRRQSETEVHAFALDPLRDSEGRAQPPLWARKTPWGEPMPDYLRELAGDSGGLVHRIRDISGVRDRAEAFVSGLKSQFLVGYSSNRALDGRYRRIKVEPTRHGVRIRHRGGYLAMPATD